MNIYLCSEYNELSERSGIALWDTLISNNRGSVVLDSKISVKGTYRFFLDIIKNSSIKLDRFHWYYPFELIGSSGEGPLAEMLHKHLMNELNINKNKFHAWPQDRSKAQEAVLGWEKEFERDPPVVSVLGLDENGGIGFNEPGSSFLSSTRLLKLKPDAQESLKKFFPEKTVPKESIGLGIRTLLRSQKIILIVTGKEKARAWANVLRGEISPKYPASFLRLHDNVDVFLDTEAASNWQNISKLSGNENHVIRDIIEGNILFMSPYSNGAGLVAGGLLSRLATMRNTKIINFYSGHRHPSLNGTREERIELRRKESLEEAKILNLSSYFADFMGYDFDYKLNMQDVEALKKQINEFAPCHIFMPKLNHVELGWYACTQLTLKALEGVAINRPLYVWFYETPWNLFQPEQINTFVPLSSHELNKKLCAIGVNHSQVQHVPYNDVAISLARFRAIVSERKQFSKQNKELSKHIECFLRVQIA